MPRPQRTTTNRTNRQQPYPTPSMATANHPMPTRTYSHVPSESNDRPSTAWPNEDDSRLMEYRAKGMNWGPIAEHFPGKTSNACRKRHERLMERKAAENLDGIKIEDLARAYLACREEMWSILAQRVGGKWQTVESKVRNSVLEHDGCSYADVTQCMEKGVKTLQTAARSSSRRMGPRHDSPFSYSSNHDPNDDTGFGGDLTNSPSAPSHLGQHPLPVPHAHGPPSFHDPRLSHATTTRSSSIAPPIIPPSSAPFSLASSSPYSTAPPAASSYINNSNSLSFTPSSSSSYVSAGGPPQTLPSFSRAFDNGPHSGPMLPSLNSYLRNTEPITASY